MVAYHPRYDRRIPVAPTSYLRCQAVNDWAAVLDVGPNIRFIAIIAIQAASTWFSYQTRKEVKTNGGSTIKDKTDHTNDMVTQMAEGMGIEVTPPSGTPVTIKQT